LIFVGWASGPEGTFPPLARRPVRGDDQAIGFHAEVDRIAETTSIDDGLWNPDTSRVADTNQWNFHRIRLFTAPAGESGLRQGRHGRL
jgi:hypothetical protein